MDVLREIFEEGYDPGSETVKSFFQTLSEDEICATLLLLACQKCGNEQVRVSTTFWSVSLFRFCFEQKRIILLPIDLHL